MARQMVIGVELSNGGDNHAIWRHPRHWANSNINLDYYKTTTLKAEEGKLDFVFLGDTLFVDEQSPPNLLNRLEPLTLLSNLAGITTHIGLVGTVSTTYTEPFNVARYFASLDHLSKGRAGWNIVTSANNHTNLNFSKSEHLQHDLRYELAKEFVEVVTGLWDSWEEDAFVADKESGVFFHPDKMHKLDFKGEHFSVRGPLPIARSNQGRPVLFQAGTSEAGKDFASKVADTMYTIVHSITEARQFYNDVKSRVAAHGRSPDDLIVITDVTLIIGETEAEARQKYNELTAFIDIDSALLGLSFFFDGIDFSQYELDEPFPELGTVGLNAFQNKVEILLQVAKEQNMTLRELALWNVVQQDTWFIGTPSQIADRLQEWFEQGVTDGFVVKTGPIVPEGIDDFVNQVVPILQERGLFRQEYEAETLHGLLHLPLPINRYTTEV